EGHPAPGRGAVRVAAALRGRPADGGPMSTEPLTTAASLPASRVRPGLADYLALTKPRVQLLLLLTTVTTMYVAGDPSVELVLATCLGGSLSAGGAGGGHTWVGRGT